MLLDRVFLIAGAAELATPVLEAFMQGNRLLIIMVAVGSALCWWPQLIHPDLGLPLWKTPLIFLALITALATVLSKEGAGWLMSMSILGVTLGICCGFWLWRPTGDDVPYILSVGLPMLVSIPVAVIAIGAGVALRESKIAQKNRPLIWCAFLVSFAFAPVVIAVTPLLIRRR
jgi:hypothetical protein